MENKEEVENITEELKQKESNVDKEKKEKGKKEKKFKGNKEIESLKEALRLSEEKSLRLSAELINITNRHQKEIEAMAKYEGEEIIKQLFPILDNFERAIKLDDNDLSDEVSKFLSGIKMIYGNMITILDNIGVKEIDCLGKEFDPVYAEAVITENDQNKPAGVVLEVFQKGYMYKDKVVRHAMVKVNN